MSGLADTPRLNGCERIFIRRVVQHHAVKSMSKSTEIVQRLAQEVDRKRGRRAKVSIDDTGISYSFEGKWFHSLLMKILGF